MLCAAFKNSAAAHIYNMSDLLKIKIAATSALAAACVFLCSCTIDTNSSLKELTDPYITRYECTYAAWGDKEFLDEFDYIRITLTDKENMELINIKCHDIRHQIHTMLGDGNIDRSELEKINEAVSIYDTLVHTVNEALDVLLTEKSLICKNKDITLTCMADCRDLAFIRDSDLYALFGNIMDNAIDAVSAFAEKEKRCIGLNIHTVASFVTVTVKNYYKGELKYGQDDLPLTTKGNTDYHGYGLKSIRLIVEKYGGELSLVAEGGIFKVNILFPL